MDSKSQTTARTLRYRKRQPTESPTKDGRESTPAIRIPDAEGRTRRKRKIEETEGPRKRRKTTRRRKTIPTLNPAGSPTKDGRKSTPADSIPQAEERSKRKRKIEETEGPRKRIRKTRTGKTPSPSKAPRQQAPIEAPSADRPGTSVTATTAPPHSRAAFEAKYSEEELLGGGGFGSVFAGHRKEDNMPVAIKHIPRFNVNRETLMDSNGEMNTVPLEVALLLKVKPAAEGTSAVVALLDWYEPYNELILVLERPVPCLDLIDYLKSKESALQENEAKIITRQLVDALIEIHSRGVFHRDIKLDNILVETGSDVPRVRIIDFGCGTFLLKGVYNTEQGTYLYTSPEWFLDRRYRAEPTTVWQLGIVLFGILHRRLPFQSSSEITNENACVSDSLSFDCKHFLLRCLNKRPEARPTLESLKQHSWLM